MATISGGLFDPAINSDVSEDVSDAISAALEGLGITEDSVTTVTSVSGTTSTVTSGTFGVVTPADDGSADLSVGDNTGVHVVSTSGQTTTVTVNTTGSSSVTSGAGDDSVVISGTGNARISTGDGNDMVTGGVGDDSVKGGSGNDTVDAGPGNNTVDGGTGSDFALVGPQGQSQGLQARSANEFIQAQAVEDYDFVVVDGQVIVSNTTTGEQTTFLNTEYIQVEDHTTIVNTNNREDSSVARVFQGYYGEQVSVEDLAAANTLVDNGHLRDLATNILSADDLLNPDTINDSDFLELMYNRVFGRDSDSEGKAWWMSALADGTKTRADVLADFGWSDEGVATYDGIINTFDDMV